MKPEGAIEFEGLQAALTYVALVEAARRLPRSNFYILTVHPNSLRYAAQLIGQQAKIIDENPLAPVLGLAADFSWTDTDEWTLSAGGQIFWCTGP